MIRKVSEKQHKDWSEDGTFFLDGWRWQVDKKGRNYREKDIKKEVKDGNTRP